MEGIAFFFLSKTNQNPNVLLWLLLFLSSLIVQENNVEYLFGPVEAVQSVQYVEHYVVTIHSSAVAVYQPEVLFSRLFCFCIMFFVLQKLARCLAIWRLPSVDCKWWQQWHLLTCLQLCDLMPSRFVASEWICRFFCVFDSIIVCAP